MAANYRSHPLSRILIEAAGATWLRRGESDRTTLGSALVLLRRGWIVGIAPEDAAAEREPWVRRPASALDDRPGMSRGHPLCDPVLLGVAQDFIIGGKSTRHRTFLRWNDPHPDWDPDLVRTDLYFMRSARR